MTLQRTYHVFVKDTFRPSNPKTTHNAALSRQAMLTGARATFCVRQKVARQGWLGKDKTGAGQNRSAKRDRPVSQGQTAVRRPRAPFPLLAFGDEVWWEKLAPHEPTSPPRYHRTGEDNADAHLKRQVMGREVVVAITKGKLDFGPWEQISYGEFDGRRRKRGLVKIIGD